MAMGNVEVIQVMNNVKAPYNLSKLASNMAHKAFDNLDVLEANIDKVLKVSTQALEGKGGGCPL
jgi:histidinol-phosphate aminotransferase